MRRLTMREVQDQYGGQLPPDAVFRPDEQEPAGPTPKAKPKRTRSERFAVLNAFVDVTLAGLSGTEAKVWLILYRDLKLTTGTARTGQADLARRCGVDPRTVRRALAVLERNGLIVVRRRGRLNAGPSVYTVHPTGETTPTREK